MDTTYQQMLRNEDRTNTNAKVLEKANQALQQNNINHAEIKLFSETYKHRRLKLFQDILKRKDDDPMRQITMNTHMQPIDHGKRRSGRPRKNWTHETAKLYWDLIIKSQTQQAQRIPPNVQLDLNNDSHRDKMRQAAENNLVE